MRLRAEPSARRCSSEARRGWAILGVVALGTFMTALDASIVNIGLPTITRTFRMPLGGAAEWVIIAYLVTTTEESAAVPSPVRGDHSRSAQ